MLGSQGQQQPDPTAQGTAFREKDVRQGPRVKGELGRPGEAEEAQARDTGAAPLG